MKEKYLKIPPDGILDWIELDRLPRHDEIYCGAEAIVLRDLHPIIGCSCVEQVYTVIPGVVIFVDESGKIKDPPQLLNPYASRLYAGAAHGDFIHGTAVVAALRPTPPWGELDVFPLSEDQACDVLFVLFGGTSYEN